MVALSRSLDLPSLKMVKIFKTPSLFYLLKVFSPLGSRRFCSKSNLSSVKTLLTPQHCSGDDIVSRICAILSNFGWQKSLKLQHLSPRLTPHLVGRIINGHKDTRSVLRFFYWVSRRTSYAHDFNCYVSMINRLVRDRLFEDADHVRILLIKSCRDADEMSRVVYYLNEISSKGFDITLYSGNTLLIALGKFDMVEVACNVYEKMLSSGIRPSLLTLNTMIGIFCNKGKLLQDAQVFLRKIYQYDMCPDVFTYTSLILGHCRNRNLDGAFDVYNSMLKEGCRPNSVTYSHLINGLCNEGRIDEGLDMLREMIEEGIEPTVRTYTLPIVTLCEIGRVEEASRLVSDMSKRGCRSNVHTYTALISGSSRAGNLEVAIGLYNRMVRHGIFPNTATYNALIHGLCVSGRFEHALKIFYGMESHGCVPNSRTYNDIINGLCLGGSMQKAMVLFDSMLRLRPSPTVATYNILIHGYVAQNNLDHALRLFDLMRKNGCEPDVYTYTNLISGFCKGGKSELASSLFQDMIALGLRPNQFTFSALIDGQCKAGNIDGALALLDRMEESGCPPSTQVYNAIISGLSKEGKLEYAEELRNRMSDRGLTSNVVTYTSMIDGLCQNGRTDLALKALREMEKASCLPNLHTYSILIHGFCQEGNIDIAEGLFEEMQNKGVSPDVVTFTSLIDGFVMIGRLDHAFLHLQKMFCVGCQPNYYTFSTLLKGLRKEKQLVVDKVAVQNDVSYSFPSVDKEAEFEVISRLLLRLSEIGCEPTVSTYATLIIGLCQVGKYYEAEQLVRNMQEKGLPLDNDIYNWLLVIYCRNLRVEPALEILKSLIGSELDLPLCTYGLVISTLFKVNRVDEAIILFNNVMEKNWNGDEIVWSILIDSLLKKGQLGPCEKLLHIIQSSKFSVSLNTYMLLAREMSKVKDAFTSDDLENEVKDLRQISPG